jgi:hypothetical protein
MDVLPEESSGEAIDNISYPALEELFAALLAVAEAYRSLMELRRRRGVLGATYREAQRGIHTFSQFSFLITWQSDLLQGHLHKLNSPQYSSNRNRLHRYSAKLSEQVKSMQYPALDFFRSAPIQAPFAPKTQPISSAVHVYDDAQSIVNEARRREAAAAAPLLTLPKLQPNKNDKRGRGRQG